MGLSSLYAADVVDFLSTYEGRPFDLTVTSPPYNLGKEYGADDALAWADYLDWTARWAKELHRCSAEDGRLALNVPLDASIDGHQPVSAQMVFAMAEAGWAFRNWLIWDKLATNVSTAYGSFARASAPNLVTPAESVLVFYKGCWARKGAGNQTTSKEFMEWRNTVWRFPGESARKLGHPAPFPEELPRRLIRLLSFETDLVCDPFVGSGTTCAVAEEQGRASIGIDQNGAYLREIAVPRIRAAHARRAGALVDPDGNRWENLPLVVAVS